MILLLRVLTVFDTETTGTGRNALVVSYGSVNLNLKTNQISERFEIFVNPNLDIDGLAMYEKNAYKITNIAIPGMTDCDQSKFVDRDIFTHQLSKRLQQSSSMLAHNAAFDKRLLDQTLLIDKSFVDNFSINLICSLKISKQIFCKEQVGGYSLDRVCDHTGVDISKRDFHGALLDAEITANYLIRLNEIGVIQVE